MGRSKVVVRITQQAFERSETAEGLASVISVSSVAD